MPAFSYKMYIAFLLGSLAFSLGIQYLAAYLGWPPYSGLAIALAVFIIFPLIIRSRIKRGGGGYGDTGTGFFGQGQGIKYICLACNNRFKGSMCPRCGSKMKRADF
ncbi:MAG: hypothetical protein AUH25_03545 [Thaumarchaeota archaeon 13_1_40CM_38_12]|nr:MAG: hypothetical protein AUH25_03545 [Thaumarchaeota archaeon 13_1_40CM_38_12]OLC34689.1 MAG: hypothetical protein AUH84_04390 [Thaumarchaeota archaeon 13_1_40CM_4_38_7]OLC91523.1 MAG: hypothetical protein AUI92_07545 [Thaumarchaeota archaeon 13_1_40CM_3_38_6]